MDAKSVAVLGVLAAVGAALRPLGGGVAGFEPVFFLLVLAGRVLGPRLRLGARVGDAVRLGAAHRGRRPVAAVPDARRRLGRLPGRLPAAGHRTRARSRCSRRTARWPGSPTALLMNLWLWPFTAGLESSISYVAGDPLTENLARFIAFTLVTSLGFDIPRALTTAALVAVAAPAGAARAAPGRPPGRVRGGRDVRPAGARRHDGPVTDLDDTSPTPSQRPDDEVRRRGPRPARRLRHRPARRPGGLAGRRAGHGAGRSPRRTRLLLLADEVPAAHGAGRRRRRGRGPARRPPRSRGAAGRTSRTPARPTRRWPRLLAGAALVDEEVDAGTDLLVLALPDPDLAVPAATLVGLLTRLRRVGGDGDRSGRRGLDGRLRGDPGRHAARPPVMADQVALLAAVGGADLAAATGLLLQAAAAAYAGGAGRTGQRRPPPWSRPGCRSGPRTGGSPGTLSPDPAHQVAP